jgi:hypothetical protein
MSSEIRLIWKAVVVLPTNGPNYSTHSKFFNNRTGNAFLRRIGGNLRTPFQPTILEPTNIFKMALLPQISTLGFKGKQFPIEIQNKFLSVYNRVNFIIHLYGTRVIILTIRLDPFHLEGTNLDFAALQDIRKYEQIFTLTKVILGLISTGDCRKYSASNDPKIYPCSAVRSSKGDKIITDSLAVEVITRHTGVNNDIVDAMLIKNRVHQVDQSSLLIDRQGIFARIPSNEKHDKAVDRFERACNMIEMATAIFYLFYSENIAALSADEYNAVVSLVEEPARLLTGSTTTQNIWQLLLKEFKIAEHLSRHKYSLIREKTTMKEKNGLSLNQILQLMSKFWHDPVLSKVIAAGIIFIVTTVAGGYYWYSKSETQIPEKTINSISHGNQSPAIGENNGNVNINIYNNTIPLNGADTKKQPASSMTSSIEKRKLKQSQ